MYAVTDTGFSHFANRLMYTCRGIFVNISQKVTTVTEIKTTADTEKTPKQFAKLSYHGYSETMWAKLAEIADSLAIKR